MNKSFPPEMIVLNLDLLGYEFMTKLTEHIVHASDWRGGARAYTIEHDHERHAAIMFQAIIEDIIRLLDKPPVEAVELIQTTFPRFDGFREILLLLQIKELDILYSMIRDCSLKIFLKIRQQLPPQMNALYSLRKIKVDCLVVEKTHFPF